MPSVGEEMEKHRELLEEGEIPSRGSPVLIEAARGDERLLPKPDDPIPAHKWHTQVIEEKQIDAEAYKVARREQIMVMQEVVADASQVFRLTKAGDNESPNICIGRGGRNDIVLVDDTISSVHAVVDDRGTGMFLTDHNSKNGTFVNDNELADNQEARLSSGDRIRLGKRVLYYLSADRYVLFLELRIHRDEE